MGIFLNIDKKIFRVTCWAKNLFFVLFLCCIGLTSCVPKPTEEQVIVRSIAGGLAIHGGNNAGVMSIARLESFDLQLINTGDYDITFKDVYFEESAQAASFIGGSYPGIGGTCDKILTPGETCILAIQLYSNDPVHYTDHFRVDYLDGIDQAIFVGSIHGFIGEPGRIVFTDFEGYHFFDLVEPEAPDPEGVIIELYNDGDLPVTDIIYEFDEEIFHFSGGPFPGENGTCQTTIPGKSSCYIHLNVTPEHPDIIGETETGQLTLTYLNPYNIRDIDIDLEVLPAELKAYLYVSEGTNQNLGDVVNFQNFDMEDPVIVTWEIFNEGYANAENIRLIGVDILDDLTVPPLIFHSETCEDSILPPQQSCEINYLVNPQFVHATWPADNLIFNSELYFEFDDNKYPEMAVIEDPVTLIMNVKKEAHINFSTQPASGLSEKILDNSYDESTGEGGDIWTGDDDEGDWWYAVLGHNIPTRAVSMNNSSNRWPVTNITFETIPLEGPSEFTQEELESFLYFQCQLTDSCFTTMNPGSLITMGLTFNPPYNPGQDIEYFKYLVRVSYDTGRRRKSYDLVIEAASKARPVMRFYSMPIENEYSVYSSFYGVDDDDDDDEEIDFEELISGESPEIQYGPILGVDRFGVDTGYPIYHHFRIQNNGPTEFYIPSDFVSMMFSQAGVDDDPQYFFVDEPDDSDAPYCVGMTEPLNNSAYCDFLIRFEKAGFDPKDGENDDIRTTNIFFTNGIADTEDPDYQEYFFDLKGIVFSDGYLIPEVEIDSGEEDEFLSTLDFGTHPWSPGGEHVVEMELRASMLEQGRWGITAMQAFVTGPYADFFTAHVRSSDIHRWNSDDDPRRLGLDVTFTSPPRGDDPILEVTGTDTYLVVDYYGRLQSEFDGTFLPEERVFIPLNVVIQDEPYIIFENNVEDLGPIPIGLTDESDGYLTIRNIGWGPPVNDSTDPAIAWLQDSDFVFLEDGAIDPESKCEIVTVQSEIDSYGFGTGYTPGPYQVIRYTLDQDEYCSFRVAYTAQGGVTTNSDVSLRYLENSDRISTDSTRIDARGLNFARLGITPGNTAGRQFRSWGDIKITNTNENNLVTILNNQSSSAEAEILGLEFRAIGDTITDSEGQTHCGTIPTSGLPNDWQGFSQIGDLSYGFFNLRYDDGDATCSTGHFMANGNSSTNCRLRLDLFPNFVDEIMGACVMMRYLPYPGAPPELERIASRRFLARGLTPAGVFNGWNGIYAEGRFKEDLDLGIDHEGVITVQWKPMDTEQDLGDVIGYHVFRRDGAMPFVQITDSFIPIDSETHLHTDHNGQYYQYRDVNTSENQLIEGEIYTYYIRPVIEVENPDGQVKGPYTEITHESDRNHPVVFPPSYMVLIDRMTANINMCTKMLDSFSFEQLDRSQFYRCRYNSAPIREFDYGKNVLMDRYENAMVNGVLTNVPENTPYLFDGYQFEPQYVLDDARSFCENTEQKIDIPLLNISDESKRLINRLDYMVASDSIDNTGCVEDTEGIMSAPLMTGRNVCQSKYGVEDLIGNAWAMLDTEIVRASPNWTYVSDSEDQISGGWPLDIEQLDVDQPMEQIFLSYDYYLENNNYNDLRCIHRFTGLPLPLVSGGICPDHISFDLEFDSAFKTSMQVSSSYDYLFVSKDLGESFELDGVEMERARRILFAGGSYNSRYIMNAPINRWSMFWSNPHADWLPYMLDEETDGDWEGGAARCAFDFDY